MKTYLISLFLLAFTFSVQASISINGTVLDKAGKPVKKCDVYFNKEKWITKDSVHVTCNEHGEYQAEIEPGHYNSLYICDEDKYAKSALEFWGWNLNLTESQKIDAVFDAIEVYSLSVWASNGGSNSIFASFRPMMLKNPSDTVRMKLKKEDFRHEVVKGKKIPVLDITPNISPSSIVGEIGSERLELLDYFWSYEKLDGCGHFPKTFDVSGGCYMPMIIAQFKKPKLKPGKNLVRIKLIDDKTHQVGESITQFEANGSGYGF